MSLFRSRFKDDKTIIGMVHLPPLPGYPESPGIEHAIRHAVADLHALEEGGVDGVLIENEYDRPHRVESAPETTAGSAIREAKPAPTTPEAVRRKSRREVD